jgi:uncharacterized protein (DUF433 family)
MKQLSRITFNPEVMGGKPCIRGLRVTVDTVVGLMASGHTLDKFEITAFDGKHWEEHVEQIRDRYS